MPRNMSFAHTQPQIKARTKTVTRRLGWQFLKPGDELNAVDRTMGFKPGQHPKVIARLRVVSVRTEELSRVTRADVRREGFPDMTTHEFVQQFCLLMRCFPSRLVTRIEFVYL